MPRLVRSSARHRSYARPLLLALGGLAAAGSISAGCTQNFGIFEPSGSTTSSTSSSGMGGSGGSSSTTTGTGGTGGTTTTTAAASGGGGAGGTTTTTTTGAGGMGGTGGSVTGPEDCTNGVDDDKNGKVDCEDTACQAFQCVPSAPPSWNGPVTLFTGDPASAPMACPSEHPQVAYEGAKDIISLPAMCSACSCSAPAVTCTPGALSFRNMASCVGGVGMAVQPGDGVCGPINPPQNTEGYAGQNPTITAGACTKSGGVPTIPPVQWQTVALACTGGGQGAGCGAQSVCVAKSDAPFQAGACVWRSGDKSCPAGFPQKHLYVDDVIEQRDCTPCACGAADATCTVVTTVYDGNDCTGNSFDVPNDQSCVAGALGVSIKPKVTKSGSCPVSGGQPTGSVKEGNAQTTVCCTN